MKTQVGIIGAGPAGLMLAHLLHSYGVESVVLETKSRTYVENRIRAGVLEQGTVELIDHLELGSRMHAEGMLHRGVELGFQQERHRIDLVALTGRAITVYGQHEVVKDLIAATETRDIPIYFEVEDVVPHSFDESQPSITFVKSGDQHTLHCDFIAGCDGFHGVCRSAVPPAAFTIFDQTYPYSWLGILAQAAPSQEELVYMNSDRGFALFSMRSSAVTRLYLQCKPDEAITHWSDDRIWSELFLRFECKDGWKPNEGPIVQKSITPMRSFVIEPMQYGRLFLAGDAAHIVPPTGAKGMNLAVSDAKLLSEGIATYYADNSFAALDRYSSICLHRVWRAQRFSWWMTSILHRNPDGTAFEHRRQVAELDYVTHSVAALTALAENYVGLPLESLIAEP